MNTMTQLAGSYLSAVSTPRRFFKKAYSINRRHFLAALIVVRSLFGWQGTAAGQERQSPAKSRARAHAIFTVAESKRLIARAVAKMPLVLRALKSGKVIVCKGTTNTYVAEELLGRPIPHGAYVLGNITPQKGGRPMPEVEQMSEVVFVDGKYRPDVTLDQALQELEAGDVVIKGGNALDYSRRTVGVWTGSPTGGTAGKIMPRIAKRKAHLVIPIGLEKLVAGRIEEIAARTGDRADYLTDIPRMRVLKGEIVTEIEALRILANVEAFQASAGGVGGAEGAVWMIWEGKRENVEQACGIAAAVQGEKPFIE